MSNRTLYWIVGGVLAVLLVVMLVTFDYNRDNKEAQQKAEELVAAYDAAGLRSLDADAVAELLGDDGAPFCDLTADDLQSGYLKTRLAVGGEFYFRPVVVDRDTVKGLVLIAQVYCPDKLENVKDFYDSLDYDHVVRG